MSSEQAENRVIAHKPARVNIVHKGPFPSFGEFTRVVDAETGEDIPNIYRVVFDSKVDELVKCRIYTYEALIEAETSAELYGVNGDTVFTTLVKALTDARVDEATYEVVTERVADVLYGAWSRDAQGIVNERTGTRVSPAYPPKRSPLG